MNKINYIVILFLCMLALASCSRKEYLDIKPKGVVIPAKLADFRLLLDNVVSTASSGAVTSGFTAKHQSTVLMSDNVKLSPEIFPVLFKQDYEVRAYLFQDTVYGPSEDDRDWNNYYQQIYVANVILAGLQEIPEQSTEKEVLEAEARVHRAYAYFNLVNMYAAHYNSATADNDPGVPIREGIELAGVDLTRASVKAVYDLVIEDLVYGTQHLPGTQPLSLAFRPSKAAAFGLLARVYLYQAKYTEALAAVEAALDLYSTLRDINNDPVSFYAPGLRVFPNQTADPEIIWFKDMGGLLVNASSDELMDLYETGDVRREWYSTIRDNIVFSANVDGFIYAAQLFVTNTSAGVSTAGLYLIRAECNARLGHLPEANDDLNTLRGKRFKPADFTALNISEKTELLNFVKNERRRELASADAERLFDIKRYNLLDHDGISITRSYNGKTVTVVPDSRKWVLPIGIKYIQIDPEIKQNPRN